MYRYPSSPVMQDPVCDAQKKLFGTTFTGKVLKHYGNTVNYDKCPLGFYWPVDSIRVVESEWPNKEAKACINEARRGDRRADITRHKDGTYSLRTKVVKHESGICWGSYTIKVAPYNNNALVTFYSNKDGVMPYQAEDDDGYDIYYYHPNIQYSPSSEEYEVCFGDVRRSFYELVNGGVFDEVLYLFERFLEESENGYVDWYDFQ